MPVYALACPNCGHEYCGMVLEGTRPPPVWECSECGSDQVALKPGAAILAHPWEQREYHSACLCCAPKAKSALARHEQQRNAQEVPSMASVDQRRRVE